MGGKESSRKIGKHGDEEDFYQSCLLKKAFPMVCKTNFAFSPGGWQLRKSQEKWQHVLAVDN